jgi:iron complex outermembrane receptor protein
MMLQKKDFFIFCIVIALITFNYKPVFSQKLATGSITGKVISNLQMPLAGVHVFLPAVNRHEITDTNGKFYFSNIEYGKYKLYISFSDYPTVYLNINLNSQLLEIEPIKLIKTELVLDSIVIHAHSDKKPTTPVSLPSLTINKDFLTRFSGNTLLQPLERLAGINVINLGVGISKPVIRGMTQNRVSVIENGIKQEGQQWALDHGLEIDPFNVQTVEIIKGPNSLIWGSDAIGGVIVIKQLPPPSIRSMQFNLITGFRSNNSNNFLSAFIEKANNASYFRFRLSTQLTADYRVPANQFYYNRYILPIHNQQLKNTAGKEISTTLTGGIKKRWGFTQLIISYFGQRYGLFSGATGIPRAYNLLPDASNRNTGVPYFNTQHLKITNNTSILLNKKVIEFDLAYQKNDRQEFSSPHAHNQRNANSDSLALFLGLQTWSGNLRIHLQQNALQAVVGLSAQYQRNIQNGFEFIIPGFYNYAWGAFSFVRYSLNSKLVLTGGLRLDNAFFSIDSFGNIININSSPRYLLRNPAIKRTYMHVTTGAGIEWIPFESLTLKFNTGNAFRYPTVAELSANGVHHGAFRHELGTQNLKPENGIQFDCTIKYQKHKIECIFTPYYYFFNNYIYLKPLAQYSYLPEGGQLYRYTADAAIHLGAELVTKYQILQPLTLTLTAEYLKQYNYYTNLPLPLVPPPNLQVEMEWTKKLSQYTHWQYYVNMTMLLADKQFAVDRNEKTTDGYLIWHLSAGIEKNTGKFQPQLTFQIQNLTNQIYYNHLSRYRTLNLPEPARNFVISLAIRI